MERFLQPWIHGLAFQSQHAKHAFVNAPQRLALQVEYQTAAAGPMELDVAGDLVDHDASERHLPVGPVGLRRAELDFTLYSNGL